MTATMTVAGAQRRIAPPGSRRARRRPRRGRHAREGPRHLAGGQLGALLGARSQRSATRLLALGVEPGDRVAIHSENRPEWLYADLAHRGRAGA